MQIHHALDTVLNSYFSLTQWEKGQNIGIEFEVEGKNLYPFNDKYWVPHTDGSLRHGFEWTTTRPLTISEVEPAIISWFENAKNCKFEIIPSLRTSIHVHINAQHLTFRQIYTIITAYWLLENLLCRYSGPAREGNLFCLRVKDADYICSELAESLLDQTFFNRVSGNEFKYAALNLQALTKYGSFEFRMMRGEYGSKDFIVEWILELNKFVEKASAFSNPKEVVQFFKNSSPTDFVRKFFSHSFAQKLLGHEPYVSYPLMEENFHYAFALSTCIPDWGKNPDPKDRNEPTKPAKPSNKFKFNVSTDFIHLTPVQPILTTTASIYSNIQSLNPNTIDEIPFLGEDE